MCVCRGSAKKLDMILLTSQLFAGASSGLIKRCGIHHSMQEEDLILDFSLSRKYSLSQTAASLSTQYLE